MEKSRLVNIPAKGGAPQAIRCTMTTTKMVIQEDGSANAGTQQGLIYQLLFSTGNGQFTPGPTITIVAGDPLVTGQPNNQPIVIEAHEGDHSPNRMPIGTGGSAPYPVCPGGPVTNGTPVIQLTSNSAQATVVAVTEWD